MTTLRLFPAQRIGNPLRGVGLRLNSTCINVMEYHIWSDLCGLYITHERREELRPLAQRLTSLFGLQNWEPAGYKYHWIPRLQTSYTVIPGTSS